MSENSLEDIQEVPAVTKRVSLVVEEKTSPKLPRKPRILIGIDASHECEKAFDWYADTLHRPGNELVLVHVAFPPVTSTQQVMYMTSDHWKSIVGEEKNKVKLLEDRYASKMRARGMTGRIKALFHQKIGEALVDIAKDEKITHIVLGSRGEGRNRGRSLVGTTSDYILKHVHCPVSLYRDEEPPSGTGRRRSSLSSMIISSIRRNSMR